MFGKGSKLYSILQHKCPKCHEGDLFTDPNTYNLPKIFEMPERCPNCAQKYEIEIQFWWGAMYVAYAISAVELLSLFALMYFVFGWTSGTCLTMVAIIGLALAPYVFRTSRAIWINIFVHYQPPKKD